MLISGVGGRNWADDKQGWEGDFSLYIRFYFGVWNHVSILFIQGINNKIKFKITIYCGTQNEQSGLDTCKSWGPHGALQTGGVFQGPPPLQWVPWLAVVLHTRMHISIIQNDRGRAGLWVSYQGEPASQRFWDLGPLYPGQLHEGRVPGCLVLTTQYSSTEASSAVPGSRGRSGDSDPGWRSLRSPGWAESSPCQP